MPTLHAGIRPDGEFRKVSLTDDQMAKLGFRPKERPEKLGCGDHACVYLPTGAEAVVKVTKDPRDARVSSFVLGLGSERPSWLVPIYAVYRIRKAFVVVAARVDELPDEWADPIDAIFDHTDEFDISAAAWPRVSERIRQQIVMEELKKGRQDDESLLIRRALTKINDAVEAFKSWGLDWGDFHSENWGIYDGSPVVIDFGLDQFKPNHPFYRPEAKTLLPPAETLPILF